MYNVLQIFVAKEFGHSVSKAGPVKQLRSAITISSVLIIGNLFLKTATIYAKLQLKVDLGGLAFSYISAVLTCLSNMKAHFAFFTVLKNQTLLLS